MVDQGFGRSPCGLDVDGFETMTAARACDGSAAEDAVENANDPDEGILHSLVSLT